MVDWLIVARIDHTWTKGAHLVSALRTWLSWLRPVAGVIALQRRAAKDMDRRADLDCIEESNREFLRHAHAAV